MDDGGWMAWDSDSEEGEEGDSEFTPSVSEYEEVKYFGNPDELVQREQRV